MVKDFQTYINEGLFDRNQSEFSIRKTDKGIEQIYIPKTKEELYSYIDIDIEQAKKDGTYPNVNLNNIDVSELGDDVLKNLFSDDIYMINPDISDWNIKSIPNSFFDHNKKIEEFIIPDSVTSIGGWAFYQCSGLTSITIGNSVTIIKETAFYYCSSLTSVVWNAKNCADFSSGGYTPFCDVNSQITSFTFGSEVEHIPAHLCYGMENLTSVTIPNSVTSIGEEAFVECNELTSVIIPNGVTRLEDGTFTFCSSLKSVTIPSSVTSIGKYAFWGCDLKDVTISKHCSIKSNSFLENCKIIIK